MPEGSRCQPRLTNCSLLRLTLLKIFRRVPPVAGVRLAETRVSVLFTIPLRRRLTLVKILTRVEHRVFPVFHACLAFVKIFTRVPSGYDRTQTVHYSAWPGRSAGETTAARSFRLSVNPQLFRKGPRNTPPRARARYLATRRKHPWHQSEICARWQRGTYRPPPRNAGCPLPCRGWTLPSSGNSVVSRQLLSPGLC